MSVMFERKQGRMLQNELPKDFYSFNAWFSSIKIYGKLKFYFYKSIYSIVCSYFTKLTTLFKQTLPTLFFNCYFFFFLLNLFSQST